VEPNAPTTAQAAPAAWKVVVLPTKDDRADQRAGGGIDVFGQPDLLVRTEAGLPAHLDEVVRGKLSAAGVESVPESDSVPRVQLRIESVVLRRDPGAVTAHYSGTADVRLVISGVGDGPQEMRITGQAEREASGVRALEQNVLNDLLTATLDDVAERVANAVLAVLRDEPPPELRPATSGGTSSDAKSDAT
jgi:hypothetical protein